MVSIRLGTFLPRAAYFLRSLFNHDLTSMIQTRGPSFSLSRQDPKSQNPAGRKRYRAAKLDRSISRAIPAVKKAMRAGRFHRKDSRTLTRDQQTAERRSGPQNPEFLKLMRTAMAHQEKISKRVKANAEKRQKAMAHRDAVVESMLKIQALFKTEREERERRAQERAAREELENKAREERILAEQEAWVRAQKVKLEEYCRPEKERRAKERAENEARIRAEREKLEEHFRREKERRANEERQRVQQEQFQKLRETSEQQPSPSHLKTISLYHAKWDALRSGIDANGCAIPPLSFELIPWPTFQPFGRHDITRIRVEEFLFHPLRRHSRDGKSKRSVVRNEMIRWHPDKFNATVLPKVKETERQAVAEVAGDVARWLNSMMDVL